MATTGTESKTITASPQIDSTTTSSVSRLLLGKPLEWWVDSANLVYLWALGIAAASAIVIAVLSWKIIGWQREIAAEKDAAFDGYKLEVEGKVADARKEGIEAGKAAGDAAVVAGNANLRAGQAEERAENVEAENLKLRAQIAPRRIQPDESKRLAESWAQFAGATVKIDSYALDAEGAALALQIMDTLSAAGIRAVDSRFSVVPMGDVGFGVFVVGHSALAEALHGGLASVAEPLGLQAVGSRVPTGGAMMRSVAIPSEPLPAIDAIITVGIKPLPKQ